MFKKEKINPLFLFFEPVRLKNDSSASIGNIELISMDLWCHIIRFLKDSKDFHSLRYCIRNLSSQISKVYSDTLLEMPFQIHSPPKKKNFYVRNLLLKQKLRKRTGRFLGTRIFGSENRDNRNVFLKIGQWFPRITILSIMLTGSTNQGKNFVVGSIKKKNILRTLKKLKIFCDIDQEIVSIKLDIPHLESIDLACRVANRKLKIDFSRYKRLRRVKIVGWKFEHLNLDFPILENLFLEDVTAKNDLVIGPRLRNLYLRITTITTFKENEIDDREILESLCLDDIDPDIFPSFFFEGVYIFRNLKKLKFRCYKIGFPLIIPLENILEELEVAASIFVLKIHDGRRLKTLELTNTCLNMMPGDEREGEMAGRVEIKDGRTVGWEDCGMILLEKVEFIKMDVANDEGLLRLDELLKMNRNLKDFHFEDIFSIGDDKPISENHFVFEGSNLEKLFIEGASSVTMKGDSKHITNLKSSPSLSSIKEHIHLSNFSITRHKSGYEWEDKVDETKKTNYQLELYTKSIICEGLQVEGNLKVSGCEFFECRNSMIEHLKFEEQSLDDPVDRSENPTLLCVEDCPSLMTLSCEFDKSNSNNLEEGRRGKILSQTCFGVDFDPDRPIEDFDEVKRTKIGVSIHHLVVKGVLFCEKEVKRLMKMIMSMKFGGGEENENVVERYNHFKKLCEGEILSNDSNNQQQLSIKLEGIPNCKRLRLEGFFPGCKFQICDRLAITRLEIDLKHVSTRRRCKMFTISGTEFPYLENILLDDDVSPEDQFCCDSSSEEEEEDDDEYSEHEKLEKLRKKLEKLENSFSKTIAFRIDAIHALERLKKIKICRSEDYEIMKSRPALIGSFVKMNLKKTKVSVTSRCKKRKKKDVIKNVSLEEYIIEEIVHSKKIVVLGCEEASEGFKVLYGFFQDEIVGKKMI